MLLLALSLATSCGKNKDLFPEDAVAEHVVIVVLDGASGLDVMHDGSSRFSSNASALLPTFWSKIRPHGTLVQGMMNSAATSTGPAHCNLLTGRHVPMGQFGTHQGPGAYVPLWPNLYDVLQGGPGAPDGGGYIVGNGILLYQTIRTAYPEAGDDAIWSFVGDDAGDDTVMAQSLRLMKEEHPRFLLANNHEIDRDGHSGLESQMVGDMSDVDNGLAALWSLILTDPEYKDRTLLIVTSDHGRHLDDWSGHGDSCRGCRTLPFFIAGPGVKEGAEVSGGWDQIDVAPTIASLMGLEMPYAQGMPISAVMEASAGSRSGALEYAGAAAWEARVVFTADPAHRTEVRVGDVRVSSPEAREARAPVMASGAAGTMLCWREMLDEGDWMPWVPECRFYEPGVEPGASEGTAVDPGVSEVFAYWRPDILAEPDGFLFAWVDNPLGDNTEDGTITTRLSRYRPGGAVADVLPGLVSIFPMDPSVVSAGGAEVVAWAASTVIEAGRYTRSIFISVAGAEGWSEPRIVSGRAFGDLRLETPQMKADAEGEGVWMSFLGIGENRTELGLLRSEDGGLRWGQPIHAGNTGSLLPGVRPLWWGERLVWAEYGPVEASICAAVPGEAAVCAGAGSMRVEQIVAREDGLYAVIDRGTGQWEIVAVGL